MSKESLRRVEKLSFKTVLLRIQNSKGTKRVRVLLLLSLTLFVASIFILPIDRLVAHRPFQQTETLASQPSTDALKGRLQESYGRLPLSFEANRGQTDPQVDFISRGKGYALFLTAKEAVLALNSCVDSNTATSADRYKSQVPAGAVLRMKLDGSKGNPRVGGRDELPGKVNYFIGNDPKRWRTGIPTYARASYQEVYEGVDLVYYGNQSQLEYDFVVGPGTDPSIIAISFEGADKLQVDEQGDLVLRTGAGEIRQQKPMVYQDVDGARRKIAGHYELRDKHTVGFQVGDYDATRPLVIDPVLVYSTFVGGGSNDEGWDIAVDVRGNAYVTGLTLSNNFPTTVGAFDTTFNGSLDAFVTKLDPTGSSLVYSTYLGGVNNEQGYGIGVDSNGSAYMAGWTGSGNFPVTIGAFDTTLNGSSDAFVTKLDPTGSSLVYSTYLGGSNSDEGHDIAVDVTGNAYVTGWTLSNDFRTTLGAFDTTPNGSTDAFVTEINPIGSGLVYSTYLGGGSPDQGEGIILDATGTAYVTGLTQSGNFPTTIGAFDTTFNGFVDAFVTKINPVSSGLVYSTFLGGSNADQGLGIALDGSDNAYVIGVTASINFPTTIGAFDPIPSGPTDAFVTKLDLMGSSLVYSTYLGGNNIETGWGIVVDITGNAYVSGLTSSSDFPATIGAFDTTFNGTFDAFVTNLDPSGSSVVYSTFLGGTGDDRSLAIAMDVTGNAYVTGWTTSTNFPTTPGAFDTSYNGGFNDAFVAKFSFIAPPATLTLDPPVATNPVGTGHCVTATVQDAFGKPTPNIIVRFMVTGSVNTTDSVTTDANGQATFCYGGPTSPGPDVISAYADTDGDDMQDVGEPANAAIKIWVAGTPATLVLSPPAATNPVGTRHCVTATVQDAFGNPTPDVIVRFTVTGSVNTSGAAATDENGQAIFCYIGPPLPGADTITAYADTDKDDMQDFDEPSGVATKLWVLPTTTPLCEISITNGGWIIAANGDRSSFGGNAKADEKGETQGQEEYQDHGPVQPFNMHSINVLAIVCESPTRASIYGQATIDGSGMSFYRINVQDLGEPGNQDTYWLLLSGYDSGEQVLRGGNVQIRRQ